MNKMWEQFKKEARQCTACRDNGLLEKGAYPLFMLDLPKSFDILFILEAPNAQDTYDQRKGYLTFLEDTDPTGIFFSELYSDQLKFHRDQLFVTNSVLCLPKKNKFGRNDIKATQRNNCVKFVKAIIDSFKPKIVCTLGEKAFRAMDFIDWHGSKIELSVATKIQWYDRILFPLYHTSKRAQSTRKPYQQKNDWTTLRALYDSISN